MQFRRKGTCVEKSHTCIDKTNHFSSDTTERHFCFFGRKLREMNRQKRNPSSPKSCQDDAIPAGKERQPFSSFLIRLLLPTRRAKPAFIFLYYFPFLPSSLLPFSLMNIFQDDNTFLLTHILETV